jgi:hypothetical protein
MQIKLILPLYVYSIRTVEGFHPRARQNGQTSDPRASRPKCRAIRSGRVEPLLCEEYVAVHPGGVRENSLFNS